MLNKIFEKMLLTKQLTVAIDFHSIFPHIMELVGRYDQNLLSRYEYFYFMAVAYITI